MAVTLKNINYIETGEIGWQNILDNFETLRAATESGRCATIVVAAADSLHPEQADYVCDGTDDQVTIQAAIDAAYAAQKGTISQMEGNYDINAKVVGKDYVDLIGSGYGTIWDVSGIPSGNSIELGGYSRFGNMKIKGSLSPSLDDYQAIVPGNHCSIDHLWVHEMGYGIDASDKTDVHISNYLATNLRSMHDWSAAIRASGTADGIYINNVHIEGCNRGIEIEDGAKNVFASHGILKTIQNYNATGNPAFSMGVHSHVGGGSVDNAVFRDFYLEDCEAINAQHAGTGYADADMPTNIKFEDIVMKNPKSVLQISGHNIIFDDVTLKNVDLTTQLSAITVFKNSDNIQFSKLRIENISGNAANDVVLIRSTDTNIGTISIRDSVFDPGALYDYVNYMIRVKYATALIIDNLKIKNIRGYGGIEADSHIGKATVRNCWLEIDAADPGAYAMNLSGDCAYVAGNTITGNPTTTAIGIHSTISSIITENDIETDGIWMRSDSANGQIFNNRLASGNIVTDGSGHCVRNNYGFITENSGIATLANGTTSIPVAHGLAVTPVAGDIVVTPIEAWGNMTTFYIDTYTATHFTIRSPIDPGQDVDFAWKAIVL